jgi:hypothetical protein
MAVSRIGVIASCQERPMTLVDRIKNILLTPKTEWLVIEAESGDPGLLFSGYVAILAAVPAVALLLRSIFVGVPIVSALVGAIVGYVLYVASWYVEALIIDALAPTFAARKDMPSALKLAAYSNTAAWLAGIFRIIPGLAILSIVGLYSLYLLWLGLPVLMKSPPDKAVGYTAAIIVIMIVIFVVVSFVLGALLIGVF